MINSPPSETELKIIIENGWTYRGPEAILTHFYQNWVVIVCSTFDSDVDSWKNDSCFILEPVNWKTSPGQRWTFHIFDVDSFIIMCFITETWVPHRLLTIYFQSGASYGLATTMHHIIAKVTMKFSIDFFRAITALVSQ